MMKQRCVWCSDDPRYINYHDLEWGELETEEAKIVELLFLETQQAGLSWWTVLKKRENYRQVFHNFSPEKIVTMGQEEIAVAMQNPGLIRHQQKLESIVENAVAYLRFRKMHGQLKEWLWEKTRQFYGEGLFSPRLNRYGAGELPPASTDFSDALAKELKQLGFKRLGSVTVYAWLQAIGIVNDHTAECYKYPLKFTDRAPLAKGEKREES